MLQSDTGIIFDVQRCCLHDGPGIRTTVFFKGCPLRCLWCHNPESQAAKPQLSFDSGKCRHCLACVAACHAGAHRADADRHVLERSHCQLCGQCVPQCLAGALKIIGQPRDVPSLMREIEKDRKFYKSSGGGVTLSGGEPTAQFEFCRNLLSAVKNAGIHACLETCGLVEPDRLTALISLVDLFLFDYKATDPDLHRHLMGVSNERILANLDMLLSRGVPVILRCPLVPGVNDQPEHLRAIADLAKRHSAIRGVEIMAYHSMGRDKAQQVGQQPGLHDIATTDEPTKNAYVQTLAELGCSAVLG